MGWRKDPRLVGSGEEGRKGWKELVLWREEGRKGLDSWREEGRKEEGGGLGRGGREGRG